MVLLWQFDIVNTSTLVQFYINIDVQYAAVVIGEAVKNFSYIKRKVLIKPIIGFNINNKFIVASESSAEKIACIATLTSFLSTLIILTVIFDITTNNAIRVAISSQTGYMKEIISRGDGNCFHIEKSIYSKTLTWPNKNFNFKCSYLPC